MSGLAITDLNKTFGAHPILNDISLDVAHGQFVCLLGPSGCGKTTLLRIIAGLDTPTSGKILLDGHNITNLPAHARDFGMVFQSLALFPHLTVGENVSYPMRIRGVPKAKQRIEVERLLDLVRLPDVAERAINQLSGGQRQRVAIARALALRPKLFLLDEPMSALDAKLREAMQIELKRLQRDLGITTFLVTHDQREAMTTADRVVVMSNGVIQQVAHPIEVYRRPANAFVADFVGQANLIEADALGDGRAKVVDTVIHVASAPSSGSFSFSVRPENLILELEAGENTLTGTVSFVRQLGASTEISINIAGQPRDMVVAVAAAYRPVPRLGEIAHVRIPQSDCVVLA